jgi:hypothetical protein
MEQAWQTSFAIVDHIAGDLKTTPRVSLSEIWYKSSLQSGPVQPMSELEILNAWNLDVVKVGLVYILAGTGVTDIAALPNTPGRDAPSAKKPA